VSEPVSVGRIVHVFDRDLEDSKLVNKRGPYPAIVMYVHADGTVDLTGFPYSSLGEMHNVPLTDGGENKGRAWWWAWPV
jgi:hypothetical protein